MNKEKKNSFINLLLYLSFAMANWLSTRGVVSNLATSIEDGMIRLLVGNEISAALIGGILPTLIYAIVTRLAFFTMQGKFSIPTYKLSALLKPFFIVANLAIFAVGFAFVYIPSIRFIFEPIVHMFIYTVAFALYIRKVCKDYFDPHSYSAVIATLGMDFLLAFLLFTLYDVTMSIMV